MKISQLITQDVADPVVDKPREEHVEIVELPTSVVTEEETVLEERAEPKSATQLNVYGHDMSDPSHKNFSRELKIMKETDPVLYHKIITLH